MKKSKLLLFGAFFLFVGVSLIAYFGQVKKPNIVKVLATDAYSYLSEEAKEYVEKVYEETGQIIRTEKNKEENVPYLNPKYVDYLSATEEEKEQLEIIPVAYLVDYTELEEVKEDLPEAFDLRNINGQSFITPTKDQNPLDLCWDFASVEQIESNIMLKENRPYVEGGLTFSTRQIDYASSKDGLLDYQNINGVRDLGQGGNFLTSSFLLANGLGLVNNSILPFNPSFEQREAASILNYGNSLYELNSTILFPKVNIDTGTATLLSYIQTLKKYVKQSGGLYVETEAPGSSCGSNNSNGGHIIRVDSGCTQDAGHAMQIIGWDDNYSYSYCKSGNLHNGNITNCNSLNIVTGKGAWILRNSWGNNYPYVYLAYDSIDDLYYSFTNVSSMNSRSWDNNYHKTLDTFYIYQTNYDSKVFEKKVSTTEKLEKIKFFPYGQNGTFKITITSGNNTYNIPSFSVPYPGVYTVDLSDQNIILDQNSFEVTIAATGNIYFLRDSMSIFTSNVDSAVALHTPTSVVTLTKSTSDYVFRTLTYTKNVPSNQNLNYSLWDKTGNNVSSYLTVTNNLVGINEVNAKVKIQANIEEGVYTLKIGYGTVTDSISIAIGDSSSRKVQFFANDGTSSNSIQKVAVDTPFVLNLNSFEREGYTFSGWNTKANGSGVDHVDGASISGISEDLLLYAQWNPITYTVRYNSNGGLGSIDNQIFTYDQGQKLTKNVFTRLGYTFANWNTRNTGDGDSYTDEQEVSNLASIQNSVITMYAQWTPISYVIKYNKNGGTGSMSNQTFYYDTSQSLYRNTFSRTGYRFVNWNTAPDGSGATYQERQIILNLFSEANKSMMLYAQWQPNTYTVQFNSNGGTGTMSQQNFTYDEEKQLLENQFTRSSYLFTGWNTKEDGSGTAYQDLDSVKNLTSTNNGTVTLYAQWKLDVPYQINHYDVNSTDFTIDAIEAKTSLSTYQSYFSFGDDYSMRIDLGNKAYIFTGSVVEIYCGEELKGRYTNIVRGDINGDGEISSLDYVKVKNHIMETKLITGMVYQKSADANKDNQISSLDYVRIKNIIMNG